MNRYLRSLVGVIAIAVVTAPVWADPIPITNHSFESPVLDAGAWTDVNQDWGDDAGDSNDQFTEHIVGFSADGNQHVGINASDTDGSGVIDPVMQDLVATYTADTQYSLTVAVGNRSEAFTLPGNESLMQLADASTGSVLAELVVDASMIPVGTFEDHTLLYSTPGGTGSPIGNGIRIVLGVGDPAGGRAHFDNVRLESDAFLFGDLNEDGVVDENDFAILSDNLAAHLDGPVTFSQGDLNLDGRIDLDDFDLFKTSFANRGLGQGQAIPEPSTLVLGFCGLIALALGYVRKRSSLPVSYG